MAKVLHWAAVVIGKSLSAADRPLQERGSAFAKGRSGSGFSAFSFSHW